MSDLNSKAKEALDALIKQRAKETEARIVAEVGPKLLEAVGRFLDKFAENSRLNTDDIKTAISSIEIKVPEITVPEIKVPEINVPAPQVTVNVPEIRVPEAKITVEIPEIEVPEPRVTVKIPEIKAPSVTVTPTPVTFPNEMKVRGLMNLDYDFNRPLPVTLRTQDGKPFEFIVPGWSGGGGRSTQPWIEVRGITDSTGASLVNPDGRLKVELSSGASTVVGDVVSDEVDTGSAPVKIGGIARTANPSAVANGDRVSAMFDDVGKQIMAPYNVRDLVFTARATLTNGTETTLLAGTSGAFNDLMQVIAANTSTGAVTVDFRSVRTGGIEYSLQIAGNDSESVYFPAPLPQSEAGSSWTVDQADVSNTTVNISALFSRNV